MVRFHPAGGVTQAANNGHTASRSRESVVTNVMIVCPVTERPVPIGLQVRATRGFRRDVPKSGSVRCLACHRRHMWERQETTLEGVAASWRRDGGIQPRLPIRHVLGGDIARY
jgi:hypothetical protein